MIKQYLVVCYAILVRNEIWALEDIGDGKPLVPLNYIIPVSEHLAKK